MRANVTPSSVRTGKRRLLSSCAITAGLMALAYGGPALAQVAGTGNVISGSATISPPGPGPTNVNTTGAQTVINWVPTDAAATGGDIDFLPAGNTWNFNGTGNYIVLNRFVNGAGGSLSRQIALNGTINSSNSAASGAQGGSIWFYNAGGILIGDTGAINVGSLVLTTNDIDRTGGLLDPATGAIRFRGTAGSTSTVTVAGSVDANQALTPGSSYVALVAPRVVQAGSVSVYGSAAYVAAEQADIRINSGLFDINVLVGAEGGNVITHTGSTSGPEQGAGPTAPAQRIYMVAIPKNVAVGMLVSGQVGYQDGAVTAITNSDGSVVLSAGYNVTNGLINTTPANNVGANITVNDIIFHSNVLAHASGAFLGQPLATVPPLGGPVTALPPPHLGRFIVEGNGTFLGDTSSTLTVNANRVAGATGTLTVRSDGRAGTGGNAAINVNGGTLLAVGGLSVIANGVADPTLGLGTGTGGTANLSVTAGGIAVTNGLQLSATGTGGITDSGTGGTGTGGTASILVSGAGSQLSANSILLDASGFGGGLTTASGVTTAVDEGGNGQGGNALLTVENGGSLSVVNGGAVLNANGAGELGNVQSGNGTGGTARVTINGDLSSYNTAFTTANAIGVGGGSFSRSPLGTFFSANGGDGRGGIAELLITSASSTLTPGGVGLDASGFGGNAGGPSENTTGGDAFGGSATVAINGNAAIGLTSLSLNAHAESGSAVSASGQTARSGNAQGGNADILATGSSTLAVADGATIDTSGNALTSENVGSAAGGNITITAVSGGTLDFGAGLFANAFGGIISGSQPRSAGSATGGNIDLLADLSGTITASSYSLIARAAAANAATSNGAAQGGSITMTALNGGLIRATSDGIDSFDVSAQTGYSQTGASATGGEIDIFANEASIILSNVEISAGGVAGGALAPEAERVTGTGGNVVIRTGFNSDSVMRFGTLFVEADGRTQAVTEGSGGQDFEPSGDGQGGTVSIQANGADLTIGGTTTLTANGYGGLGGARATGRGGIVSFTQIGGNVEAGDMRLSANGIGGVIDGQSGDGIGGNAFASFTGGTFTGGDLRVSASGFGGVAFNGDDFDPANPFAAGNGGDGQGGNASITIAGDAVVNVSVLTATANGFGAAGGDFENYNGSPGRGGNGGTGRGGFATINLTSGELNADAVVADAGGTGGNGGATSLPSSSSGTATGFGVGGDGGNGNGGFAMIELAGTTLNISESITSYSGARGGDGGGTSSSSGPPTSASVGGNGGSATGGLAQVIVDNYDAGVLSLVLDTSSFGGRGGDGSDGNAGRGGDAFGGTARVEAIGEDAQVIVSQANFEVSAAGGNGGDAYTDDASRPATAGRGGDGGFGTGGEIQIVASDGAIVGLGVGRTGGGLFRSTGTGGDAGRGADNPGTIPTPGEDEILGTDDDGIQGLQGGNGGIGGGGTGGTVFLFANGGTITSGGAPIGITVNGNSGQGGDGGIGSGGTGSCCSAYLDFGGRVLFETRITTGGAGQITLGDTVINANGGGAGRIEMRSAGNITMASLTAEALGFAFSTSTPIDEASQGIFFAPVGGTISTGGDLTLVTGSSIGVYAEGGGRVNAGGNMLLEAGDQIDLRHDDRGNATNATLFAAGDLTITAGNALTGAAGTLLAADGTLTLANSTPAGSITVDRLDGDDIVITSDGRVSVEHAEADDGFTATVGSFRTGLNSIITGGDIDITSVGAVDLGNSTAGGYVEVDGQSIAFNSISAGSTVNLLANGATTGAEGIRGGSITAGDDIGLTGNSIALTGNVTGDGSFFAFGLGGNVAVNRANVDGTISIFAAGNLTGTYVAGGDIRLNSNGNVNVSATANGGYFERNGGLTQGNLYVDAAGNVVMTDSAAARMFGVNAGGSAAISGGNAGEDMLVRAGTTATLTNVTAGDDLGVLATGNISATNVSATGNGADTHFLNYLPASGFTIVQGEGNSAVNGSDLTLSSGGSITANTLSAGDDLALLASGSIALNGGRTLGRGTTGGSSNIATQGGDTTLSGLNSFTDVIVNSTGTANVAGTVEAGRNVVIAANAVTLTDLPSSGATIDTVAAAGDVTVTSATDITGGALRAGGDLTLTAGTVIDITQGATGEDGAITLTGPGGITARQLLSRGVTTLTADNGIVRVDNLNSRDAVTVSANSLDIGTNGPIEFASIVTDVGDAVIRSNNRLIVDDADIAGTARFSNSGEHMIIRGLTAANVEFDANEMISMTNVSATNNLEADAGGTIFIDGVVTGRTISLASADIDLVATGRVGTAGTTDALSIENNDNENQTFVGGTGTRDGFHIDAAELTRLYGSAIEIFAPEVNTVFGGSVGGAEPPDVIVDTFTMTGGGPNAQGVASNLGANGSLTIRTPGKMRVIGNVQLTGLTDTNALNLIADNALEVILGQGTIRLLGANNAPGGELYMESDDIIVATTQAITDVANATTMDAINTRLGQNDGVTLDEGALFARRIAFDVVGGVYVQNSGAGTEFGQRRGLTFGAGGLDVTTESSSRIVLNGVHLGPNGQVTGLDTIPLLTIAGGSIPTGGTTGSLSFDAQSTLNGCFIANPTACTVPTIEVDRMFPVQDVIEDEDGDGDDGDGTSLPTALITMRDLDPLSGEPLLDDPVTGAGNDDLWTPTTDTQQP